MPNVLVAGRIDIDAVIQVDRHPLPGEELGGWDLRYLPGGKGANQAVAAARAGAAVVALGCVGDDSFGAEIITFLDSENIDTHKISKLVGVRTGMAFVAVDRRGQNTIIYDVAQVPPLTFTDTDVIHQGDVLVSQFDIPEPTILDFLAAGRKRGARNIFNAAPAQPISRELLSLVDVLVLNEFELAYALGDGPLDPANRTAITAAIKTFQHPEEQALIVTLGEHGAILSIARRALWIEAADVVPIDTTGAGDAFTGALAAELCHAVPLDKAVCYACASAGISVTRSGAGIAMPFRHEVLAANVPTEQEISL